MLKFAAHFSIGDYDLVWSIANKLKFIKLDKHGNWEKTHYVQVAIFRTIEKNSIVVLQVIRECFGDSIFVRCHFCQPRSFIKSALMNNRRDILRILLSCNAKMSEVKAVLSSIEKYQNFDVVIIEMLTEFTTL